MGTVEHIGPKSTRVRSLTGELIVFVNSDLLSTRLRNFQDRQERCIVLSIRSEETSLFDRAHFMSLGSFSLDFEIVYYVTSPDYEAHKDCQEAINMVTVRRLEQEGVGFAFPTQTIRVDNLSKSTLS